MPELTRATIAGSSLTIEKVPTPEWGKAGWVHCRGFPASMAEEVRDVCALISSDEEMSEAKRMALWTVLGACDKRGRRKFTQADVPMLVGKSLVALQRCFSATLRLNKVTDGDSAKNEDRQPGK